jgi:hypothetical protein
MAAPALHISNINGKILTNLINSFGLVALARPAAGKVEEMPTSPISAADPKLLAFNGAQLTPAVIRTKKSEHFLIGRSFVLPF